MYIYSDETLSTLEYAHRAKSIKNKPQMNVKMTNRAYVRELTKEITQLKRENECLRSKNGIFLPPEQYEQLTKDSETQKTQLTKLNEILTSKLGEIEELFGFLEAKNNEIKTMSEQNEALELNLTQTKESLKVTPLPYIYIYIYIDVSITMNVSPVVLERWIMRLADNLVRVCVCVCLYVATN